MLSLPVLPAAKKVFVIKKILLLVLRWGVVSSVVKEGSFSAEFHSSTWLWSRFPWKISCSWEDYVPGVAGPDHRALVSIVLRETKKSKGCSQNHTGLLQGWVLNV